MLEYPNLVQIKGKFYLYNMNSLSGTNFDKLEAIGGDFELKGVRECIFGANYFANTNKTLFRAAPHTFTLYSSVLPVFIFLHFHSQLYMCVAPCLFVVIFICPLSTIYVCSRDAAVWRCARVMTAADDMLVCTCTLHTGLFVVCGRRLLAHAIRHTHTQPSPRARHEHTPRAAHHICHWRRIFAFCTLF